MFRPACPSAYVLTGKAERFLEPRTFQNHFKSYIMSSGIKDANFHCTRHTFATRCVELGFEIKSLSEILGHANVNITLNRYVHPSFDLKRDNMNKLSCLY
ncbi:MAG: tyrosine-type recombinase/integrase [Lachnospiraceae bacterium]|nr:tyrosine-type recombinase/integrase [Lachnospiraceae bacterium]